MTIGEGKIELAETQSYDVHIYIYNMDAQNQEPLVHPDANE